MNVKKQILNAIMCAAVGTFGLGLASCNNSREVPVDSSEKSFEVTTEAFLLQEDGSLVPFATNDLKAVLDNPVVTDRGTVTGGGTYFYRETATITATAKGDYKLFTLYERNGAGSYNQERGKTLGNDQTKTISIPVEQNLNFVAVFIGVNGAEREYRNLKLNGKPENLTIGNVDGKTSSNGNFTTIGEEYSPLKDVDGNIQGWTRTNPNFKNWDAKTPSADWLKITKGDGSMAYTVEPYISMEKGPRTATVEVGKDGVGGGKGVWRTFTVTQDSYFDSSEDPNNGGKTPDKIVDETGNEVTLPKDASYEFLPAGGQKSIKDFGYGKKYFALYKSYKNGVEQPEAQWLKVELVPEYGQVANWIKVDATKTNYAAGKNTEQKESRTSVLAVTWKGAKGAVVKTTKVTFTQKAVTYHVGVENK